MGVLGVSLITLVGHRLLRWSEPSPGL